MVHFWALKSEPKFHEKLSEPNCGTHLSLLAVTQYGMELANDISNVLHLEIIMKDQFYEAVQLAFNLFYSMYSFTLRTHHTNL